jgi:glycerol-3-phosphate dehydrogenase
MKTSGEQSQTPAVKGAWDAHCLVWLLCSEDMGLLDYNTSDGRFLFVLPKVGTYVGGEPQT